MKKLILFWVLIISVSWNGFAHPVDIAKARAVAKNMYFERINIHEKASYAEVLLEDAATIQKNNVNVYYVFNVTGNRGWVAVSAEDATVPVLSYALTGTYTAANIPENFAAWMSQYEKEILYAIDHNVAQSATAADLWSYYSRADFDLSKNTEAVSPLLGSVNWGQGCYYNTQCPSATFGSCGHVPTGCVATAMAMIMKKHAYPTQGYSQHTYTHATYGTLTANFGTATYGWASMPNTATSNNTELAEIMKHCGVAVDMNYALAGSGAYLMDAAAALRIYFIYNATHAIKGTYSEADWNALLKGDLDLGRPILYGGDDNSSGHAFVCDGYQGTSNDYFHFNWGWEGDLNSYNYLNDLTPDGNSGAGNFSGNQEAVVNIYPSPAVLPQANFSANPTTLNYNSMVSFTDLSTNSPLVWSWSVTPATGFTYVTATSSASQNPRMGFTVPGVYTIALTVTNAAGSSTETKTGYITVNGGAGIDEEAAARVSIYPNPARDYVVISLDGTTISSAGIHLLNALGDVVTNVELSSRGNEWVLNTTALSEGLYYLSIRTEEATFTRKLSIVR